MNYIIVLLLMQTVMLVFAFGYFITKIIEIGKQIEKVSYIISQNNNTLNHIEDEIVEAYNLKEYDT